MISRSIKANEREKFLCNHLAVLILLARDNKWDGPEFPEDPCMYFCGSLSVTDCEIDLQGNRKIKSKLRGVPRCKTHNIVPFNYKQFKPTMLFPSTNRAFSCSWSCVKPFPSYNYQQHMMETHDFDDSDSKTDESITQEYDAFEPSDKEKSHLY